MAPGNDKVRFKRVCVRPETGSTSEAITVRTPFLMEFEYWNFEPGARLNLSIHLYNEQGVIVFNTGPGNKTVWSGRPKPVGLYRSVCHVPGDLLNDGTYRVRLILVKNDKFHVCRYDDALMFDVMDIARAVGTWYGKHHGVVRPDLKWTTELIDGGTGSNVSRLLNDTQEPERRETL